MGRKTCLSLINYFSFIASDKWGVPRGKKNRILFMSLLFLVVCINGFRNIHILVFIYRHDEKGHWFGLGSLFFRLKTG